MKHTRDDLPVYICICKCINDEVGMEDPIMASVASVENGWNPRGGPRHEL